MLASWRMRWRVGNGDIREANEAGEPRMRYVRAKRNGIGRAAMPPPDGREAVQHGPGFFSEFPPCRIEIVFAGLKSAARHFYPSVAEPHHNDAVVHERDDIDIGYRQISWKLPGEAELNAQRSPNAGSKERRVTSEMVTRARDVRVHCYHRR